LPRSAEEVLTSDGLHVTGSVGDNTESDAVDIISANDDSDDEYDTPAERQELGTLALMAQNPEPSNHGPAQVLLSQALDIQLDYVQANIITTLSCPHGFLMTSSMFKIDCSKHTLKCTLLSTHLLAS
jgi:hypothetical protein